MKSLSLSALVAVLASTQAVLAADPPRPSDNPCGGTHYCGDNTSDPKCIDPELGLSLCDTQKGERSDEWVDWCRMCVKEDCATTKCDQRNEP